MIMLSAARTCIAMPGISMNRRRIIAMGQAKLAHSCQCKAHVRAMHVGLSCALGVVLSSSLAPRQRR